MKKQVTRLALQIRLASMARIKEDTMVTCTDMLFQCCSSLKVRTGTYVLFSSSGVASEALSTVQYYIQ
jgi:hypothetical protein